MDMIYLHSFFYILGISFLLFFYCFQIENEHERIYFHLDDLKTESGDNQYGSGVVE
jgi:hypothetical protein